MKNWQRYTFDEIGEWGSGGTPNSAKPEYYNGDIPWLIIEDLNDSIVNRSLKSITIKGLANSSAKLLEPGALLIAMYGSIGKLGINSIKCATNQAIAFCRINPEVALTRYVFYYLRYIRPQLTDAGRGGTQKNISQSVLKDFTIPLPSLKEQKRIAHQLEQADRLRRFRAYALEMSDRYLRGVFLELFGEPASNPKGWNRDMISDVVYHSQYGTSEKSNNGGFGYPLIGMSNITYSGRLDIRDHSYVDISSGDFSDLKLDIGDILFNRTNSTEMVGKTAVWNSEIQAVAASYLVKLKLNQMVLPEYFSAALNMPYFKQLFIERCKRAVSQSNISPTLLKEFTIAVPPLELQTRFSQIVQKHERVRRMQLEALRQAELLYDTLLAQAFGEA